MPLEAKDTTAETRKSGPLQRTWNSEKKELKQPGPCFLFPCLFYSFSCFLFPKIDETKSPCNNFHHSFLEVVFMFTSLHLSIVKILWALDQNPYLIKKKNKKQTKRKEIKINGMLSERGVRQGDCLSPLLFTLATEPLINSIESDASLAGISLPDGSKVKVLSSADDVAPSLLCRRYI